MQFQNENAPSDKWESYRWVLNYTNVAKKTNFTMQMMDPAPLRELKWWCSLKHNDTNILKFNNATMIPKYTTLPRNETDEKADARRRFL